MNRRGQLSLVNIVVWLLLVAVGAVVSPIIGEYADTVATTTNNSLAQIVASSLVPMFWVGILITFFLYVTPIRVQQY